MQVSELMTRDPCGMQVNEPVQQAAELMRDRGIGSVLVYDGAQLAGIVTDRDLTVRCLASGQSAGSPVRECMTPRPITIDAATSADDALRLMVERQVGRLCVTDDGNHVSGVVSYDDLVVLSQLVGRGFARAVSQPALARR